MFSILLFCQIKFSYKGFATKSSLCCFCLFVCSLRWCCSSVLKRWEGLRMLLLLNLGFLRVRGGPCLPKGYQARMGFPYTIISFYLNLIFSMLISEFEYKRPFWHHWILNYKHSEFHYPLCVLDQKILRGVNLSWTSGCKYLQEEKKIFAVSLVM